ncbi:hypothetical protein ACP6JB_008564 [Aspergillus fumigatus]
MSSIEKHKGHVDDDAQLAAMGHKAELDRNFSMLSMLGLAFAILNSWTALSASLSLSLPSGGSVSVVWGLITAGICNLCIAASLAEFLSAYPTAGGQYHWVAVSYPVLLQLRAGLTAESLLGEMDADSVLDYWLGECVALVATGGLLGSQLILGVISLMNPEYEAQRWHQFLIYIAYNIAAFIINALMNSVLPYITKSAFIWSLSGFTVICITVLACASPNYSSAKFVFTDFINETGWPDGVAWLLGLLQGGLGVTGFDGVAHMIEEIPRASIVGPKIMIGCVCIGTVTGTIFLVVLLFVAGNIDDVISSAAGPLLQILKNATNSNAGAICLLIDGGLPASRFFSKVHPKLKVPLNSLYLNLALVVIFGCIFLGSTSAFNAIVSASVVLLDIAYGMPIVVNCLRGRNMLPERPFVLPNIVGWIANAVSLVYISVTTVLFLFPPDLPVSGSSMNYCVAAFGIIIVISAIQWVIDGRKNFTGPRTDMDILTGQLPVGHYPVDSNAAHVVPQGK